jgi:hypothetical protein
MDCPPGRIHRIGAYAAAWVVFDRPSFDWHAAATMATWLMTLFIQRAEHPTPKPYMQSWMRYCVPTIVPAPNSLIWMYASLRQSSAIEGRQRVGSEGQQHSPNCPERHSASVLIRGTI